MTMTDPLGDMLTRIRNGQRARKSKITSPASRLRTNVLEVLKREGFIGDYEVAEQKPQNALRLRLKYEEREPVIHGLKRVSRPGLRVQVQRAEIPRAYGGIGISIISTSKGVMTGREAWRQGLGGELWAYVW